MEDLKKLPVWAQHKIQKLTSDVAYYLEQHEHLFNGKPSNVFLQRLTGEKELYLPEETEVTFVLQDGGRKCGVNIRVRIVKNRIQVYADQQIVVLPNSSNIVDIYSKQFGG